MISSPEQFEIVFLTDHAQLHNAHACPQLTIQPHKTPHRGSEKRFMDKPQESLCTVGYIRRQKEVRIPYTDN